MCVSGSALGEAPLGSISSHVLLVKLILPVQLPILCDAVVPDDKGARTSHV